MMFQEHQTALIAVAEAGVYLPAHEELLFQPNGHAHGEQLEPGRPMSDVRRQEPIELQDRLFIKDHQIEIVCADPAFCEAVLDRFGWEARVVLLPSESFFLRGCYDVTIAHQTRCAIVIVSREAENVHRTTAPAPFVGSVVPRLCQPGCPDPT